MRVSEFVNRDNIFIDLEGMGREAVLREMVGRLSQGGHLGDADPEEIVGKLVEREMQGSTGFGQGVALPHVKSESLTRTVISIGRSDEGIDFNATDGEPVHTVFLILSPEAEAETHLACLKWVVTLAQNRYYARLLRGSRTIEQISELLDEFADESGEGR
jgi:mannitol/fructose-specific phosphotransferase system IIA component (Ntr-type)